MPLPPKPPSCSRRASFLLPNRLADQGRNSVRTGQQLEVGLLRDVLEREGTGGADLDAGGIPVAQVALQHVTGARVREGGPERTGEDAAQAADAARGVHLHRA